MIKILWTRFLWEVYLKSKGELLRVRALSYGTSKPGMKSFHWLKYVPL